MSRSYGSVDYDRAVEYHLRPVPPHRISRPPPGRPCHPLSRRVIYGVALSFLLGSMLLGYIIGSKMASFVGGGADEVDSSNLVSEQTPSTLGDEGSFRVFSLQARNEYGVFSALNLYGLDMVVEPHKETVLSITGWNTSVADRVEDRPYTSIAGHDRSRTGGEGSVQDTVRKFHWTIVPADFEGTPIAGEEPLLDITLDGGGSDGIGDGPTVRLTDAGTLAILTVEEVLDDGRVVGEGRATVSCRYVRRELRTLTAEDRDAFLDAMVEFYTAVPSNNDSNVDQPEFNHYQHFAEAHNSRTYCYHNGMMFLTAHLAFDWLAERALQMIDPAVSLPFWDYTIESGTLGADWPQSDIFGPDMFGSALGSEGNEFMVSDGRFSNVSSVYDPDHLLVAPSLDPNHNPYGYISSPYVYQDVPRLTRTHSFCGFTGTSAPPSCEDMISCFEDYDTLYDWSACIEDTVHGDMHGWLGGAWGCKVDMGVFKAEHPEYTDDLLVFILQYVTANRWPTNALFSDYNSCDTSCTRGSKVECGCHCHLDTDDMTDAQVYTVMEDVMTKFGTLYNANDFVTHDPSKKYPFNFIQDGEPLTRDQFFLLLRYIIMVGCEPSQVGAMATGASPMDPLFWMLHPMFERALHVLLLSPTYTEQYDYSWKNASCSGSAFSDELPFTEHAFGQGPGTDFLTNDDILRIAHPTNPRLPYLYDNFGTWGTCTDWNPCPECQGTV